MTESVKKSKAVGFLTATFAALVVLYFPVLSKLISDWWADENYSHGLLVPFIIGFIIWTEFDEIRAAVARPAVLLGVFSIAAAFLLLLGGTLGSELFTKRISLVLMLFGVTVFWFGTKIIYRLITPFALLLLAIPIPQIIFNKIAFPLQVWASQIAVWGIRLFGVPTVRNGNIFEILPRGATQILKLEVVEACSGIRSLMTLVTIALVLAYFTRAGKVFGGSGFSDWLRSKDVWRAVILMAAAVPVAVVTNAFRVTITGVLTYNYGRAALEGTWHSVSGWLVYVAALIILFALGKVISAVFRNGEKPNSAETSQHPFYTDIKRSAILLVILIVGGIFVNYIERRPEILPERARLSEFPMQLGEWRQKGGEIKFSQQTESVLKTTDYTMREYYLPDGRVANFYVGYYATQRSGSTYHSPQNCLPGAGWVLRDPEKITFETGDGRTVTANKYVIESGNSRQIMIYWYQGRGRSEANEYRDKLNTIIDSFMLRRTDAAMVRVMTSADADESLAIEAAKNLSAEAIKNLDKFVP